MLVKEYVLLYAKEYILKIVKKKILDKTARNKIIKKYALM